MLPLSALLEAAPPLAAAAACGSPPLLVLGAGPELYPSSALTCGYEGQRGCWLRWTLLGAGTTRPSPSGAISRRFFDSWLLCRPRGWYWRQHAAGRAA